MTKTGQIIQEMLSHHQTEFDVFREVHEKFVSDASYKEEFDRLGKPLLEILQRYENRLCGKMEGSGRGKFSSSLSDKFRSEVRKIFPAIDQVGLKVSQA